MLEDPNNSSSLISVVRVSERISLTLIIVLISIVLLVGFWKKVQGIDFKSSERIGITVSGTFAVPILVLFSLILYASIAINSQVSVSSTQVTEAHLKPTTPNGPPNSGIAQPVTKTTSTTSFVGASPLGTENMVGLAMAINTVSNVNQRIKEAGIPDNLRSEVRRLTRAVSEFNIHFTRLLTLELGEDKINSCRNDNTQSGCEVYLRMMEGEFE
ncbi:MAG: hypothetical protein ROR55_17760 [Devosia sp.]